VAILNRDRFCLLTDDRGHIRSFAFISPMAPLVGEGDDGFVWLDIGVDGTPALPVLKYWDEEGWTWRRTGGVIPPLINKGDLLGMGDSGLVRIPAGTDGQVLTADAASEAGVKWV
jgi:hypothetical protein